MIELNPKEKIILVRRRHGLALLFEIMPSLLAIAGILFMLLIFQPDVLYVYAGALGIQVFATVLMIVLTDYFLDAWIVTNERIIHAELHGLFRRTVSSLALDKIQDVTVETSGVLATIFHFGNIGIQSAGAVPQVAMKQVADPDGVKSIILEAQRTFPAKSSDEGSP